MTCAEVFQIQDLEVAADMTLEIFLSFLFAVILALVVILILLFIRYRKIIITKTKQCCFGCCCVVGGLCYCCRRLVVKGEDHADAYLLPSWEEPAAKPAEEAEENGEVMGEEEESLVLSNPNIAEFTLHVDENEAETAEQDEETITAMQEESKKEAIDEATKQSNPDPVTAAETSFNEADEESWEPEPTNSTESAARPSFADILVAPKEKQHEMIYSCEKRAFMKLESSFLQNYANFVHLCVEIMGSGLVVTEQASEEWKTGLLESCSELSKAVQLMRNEPTREEEPDLSSIMTQLTNKVYSSLNEADISVTKVEKLMTDLEQDLGKFEMLFSTIYLQETKKLCDMTNLKEVLLEMLTNNMEQLLEEMVAKHKAHIKLLEKLQMKSSLNDFSVSAQEKLARDIDKIQTTATRKFRKALAEQKNILRDDINLRMDRSSPKYEVSEESTIQGKKEQLIQRDISMTEFIDAYCSELRDLLNVETKQDFIEVNFTATEFNALMEMLGVKYLKRGIKAERALLGETAMYGSQELVAQLEIDLNNQQASLRATRQKQEQELRSVMNSPSLGPPFVEPYFDDLKMEQEFIQKLLEIQVDMSEAEQKHMKDTVTARLTTCQVQFELKKLKHERRLKNDVRSKKDKFYAKKEANASSNSGRMVLKLNQEEKNIETTHRRVIKGSKKKLAAGLQSTMSNLELLLQQQSERIRRAHETDVNLASKEERAVNVLKSKLLEKISNSSATNEVTGERLLQEYHINLQVLDEEMQKSKMHQEQVLQQKIQSRKLEKMEESKKEHSRTSPYRVGSAKRFAADCLVNLLMDVRHKENLKQLDDYNVEQGEKLKSLLERRYYINSKLALQLREREMIIKLASALNMSRSDLEEELKNSMSVAEIPGEEDSEAELLLTKGVLKLFDTEV